MNPFQTPLLLKKLKLIWKFVSSENNQSYFSNSEIEEAEKCVKVEPIENVRLEKETPLVLDLRLIPLKAGEITIHGIEYNLKVRLFWRENSIIQSRF